MDDNDYYLERISDDVAGIRASIGSAFAVFIGFCIGLFVFGIFAGGPSNEVTDYFQFCTQTVSSAQECTSWATGETKYYVNQTSQTVQFVDISPNPTEPLSFSECTVADAQNWYCNNTGNGSGFGYQNGVVADGRPYVDTGIYRHFGFWEYLIFSTAFRIGLNH